MMPGKRRSAISLKRMREHISTVVKHFRGKVFSWDVVNEAIADDQGYLRQSKWLNSLGEEFIAEAFLAAHAADPEAELYYNDYGIESPEKRAKTVKLIRELKRRNIRIDGIGIQGHWLLDRVPLKEIEETIIALHQEGVKVMITELDLDVLPRGSGADLGAAGKPSAAILTPRAVRLKFSSDKLSSTPLFSRYSTSMLTRLLG